MLKNLHDNVSVAIRRQLSESKPAFKEASNGNGDSDHVIALQTTEAMREGLNILSEDPLMVFPRFDDFHGGQVLCCGCYKLIQTKTHDACQHCKLPMCSPACVTTMDHAAYECVIFQQPIMQELVEKFTKTKRFRWKVHMLIGIYRALLLKTLAFTKWELLEKLMQYQTVEEKSRILDVIERCYNIGEILITAKQIMNSNIPGYYPPLLTQPGHEEMVVVADTVVAITCCLIKYGICLWPDNLSSGLMSLLFTTGRILHDCNPNTGGVMDKYGSIKLVTSKPLKEGTFLTFARHQSHAIWFIQGFQYRQPSLDYQMLTHMHCSNHCGNTSDNNSGINLVKCFYCQKAYLVPVGFVWKCASSECQSMVSWDLVHARVFESAKLVEKYRLNTKGVVDESKVFWDISRMEKTLSPSHFIVLALKTFYMKNFNLYWDKSDEYLKRVVQYGQGILDTMMHISGDLSYYKGMIYFYMHLAHELLLDRALSPATPEADVEYLNYHRLETMKCLIEARRNCDWRKEKAFLEEELQIHAMLNYHWNHHRCVRMNGN